jgi:urea carboxylase
MFSKILIANRGEIAARVIRTAKRLGIATVAVYSDADRFTLPVMMADEAVRLGPAPAAESYLRIDAILDACRRTGAQAVHPGYGFLSENAGFAERLAAAGITFIGPTPDQLKAFGLKHTAREIAAKSGVPLLPGSELLRDAEHARAEAARIGYPVMLKSTAGGGGIGMQLCADPEELVAKFESVQRMAGSSFGDARLYLERFVARARHVEVQIFGDGRGNVVALGERDCSLQRRNQKVVEETPAPGLDPAIRAQMREAALALGRAVGYASAGTVEFVYDVVRREAYFLEVNTRLQVEHPVTEAVFGIDLVEWMIRQAAGTLVLPPQEQLVATGHAIEVRVYAEDPSRHFRPSSGLLTEVAFPDDVRVDRWIETGSEVTPYYDPLLAKLIVAADTRAQAIDALQAALHETRIWGIETNLAYLAAITETAGFREAEMTTASLRDMVFVPATVEVILPGSQSSLQDWPGRLGHWNVGVPPSGPMDSRSHRLVNRILGNREDAATLECTVSGPTLRFNTATVITLGGADMGATLDGVPVPLWQAVAVAARQTLVLGKVRGPGIRCYLGVRNGFDAPRFLGARATFALGGFGGHATGTLKPGDTLRIAAAQQTPVADPPIAAEFPALTDHWDLPIVYGPHGAPDFFTEGDIDTLFDAEYEVHFNSARTGVRLIGPRPTWARADGGEAGLHPSNIHDNAYAIGAIDFTGDMPIILGPDGPSLGGFVCPGVVARDHLWKIGQLRPGDKVRFSPASRPLDPVVGPMILTRPEAGSTIVGQRSDGPVPVVYRRAGDDYLLVEYGAMVLDIALRLRVQLLYEAVRALRLPGVIDLTPGIRSLQIHYDGTILDRRRLLAILGEIEPSLPAAEAAVVPSRIVHLPLSWNDPSVQLAMQKYQELVRPDAPWCPSNIEFIRRINGLASIDEVYRTVFDASYLVLGLGDVYLGAPVATPVDPRHRLVTTKYNPARTWTPENAVGIGGAYLCIYGMEGPGGYQLFGRTIQMWNSWRQTDAFPAGTPWLLRFFDQIRFFPVSEAELAEAREAFPHGRYPVRIEDGRFSYADHARFLAANAEAIAAFEAGRNAAFTAERRDWKARGLDSFMADEVATVADDSLPEGCEGVVASVTGNVWKILVAVGDIVAAEQAVVVVEAMKMEMSVISPLAGRVREIRVQPGRTILAGQIVVVLESSPTGPPQLP